MGNIRLLAMVILVGVEVSRPNTREILARNYPYILALTGNGGR
jgi:hypothetical protein